MKTISTEKRNAVIEACKTRLAIDFDTPARDILSYYGSQIGLTGRQMDDLLRSLCRN